MGEKTTTKPHLMKLSLVFVIFLSLFVVISNNQPQELRGKAQTATINAKLECTADGKVQYAITFTNPETYPVDLLTDALIQQGTVSKDFFNIAPGQTQAGTITTTVGSVESGDVVFTWYQAGTTTGGNSQNFSYNTFTCSSSSNPAPTTADSTSSQPGGATPTAIPGQAATLAPTAGVILPTIGTQSGSGGPAPTFSCLGCTPSGTNTPTTNPVASNPTQTQNGTTTQTPTTQQPSQNSDLIQIILLLILSLLKALFNIN